MREPLDRPAAFDLPDHLAAKADPALIADDERHFAAIAESLEQSIADLSDRLDADAQGARRHRPGGDGPRPGGPPADGPAADAAPLRAGPVPRAAWSRPTTPSRCTSGGSASPTAPGAGCCSTGAPPRPSRSSARPTPTRWVWPAAAGTAGPRGRVSDYWDEVFTADGLRRAHAALDDQSAFIASLGTSRSPRMRDVLGTIQADQDAIIRAGSRGALVVDGGPGTGKTVVALHRAAYLLYSDPRLGHRRGRRAVRRPAPALPGLRRRRAAQPRRGGRADLHPARPRARGCRRDGRARPGGGPAQGVGRHGAARSSRRCGSTRSRPPTGMAVETPWADVWLSADDWAEAFESAGAGHAAQRGARPGLGGAAHDPGRQARRRRGRLDEVRRAARARRPRAGRGVQPGLAAARADRPRGGPVVGAGLPAHVRAVARARRGPALQRADAQAWTVSDLPLLDAARQRLGDPEASRRRRRQRGGRRRRARARWPRVVDHLIDDRRLARCT